MGPGLNTGFALAGKSTRYLELNSSYLRLFIPAFTGNDEPPTCSVYTLRAVWISEKINVGFLSPCTNRNYWFIDEILIWPKAVI